MNSQRSLFDAGPRVVLPPSGACTPAPVGSGPAGETCRTCRHYTRLDYRSGTFLKCGLMEAHWTHGAGTDIRAGWPAFRDWATLTPDS